MTVQISTKNRNPETTRSRSFPASPFRLFEDFFNDWAVRAIESDRERSAWVPPVNVLEKDGNLILKVEVPGVAEKDIDLKIDGSRLTISGEKKQDEKVEASSLHLSEISYGTFTRSFTLPDVVDPDKVGAKFKNGILTITLPSKPEARPRTIKVNAQ